MKRQITYRDVLRSVLLTLLLLPCLAWPAAAQQNSGATKPDAKPQAAAPISQVSISAAPETSADSATPAASPVLGSGTLNFIPRWTGRHVIGNSIVSQTGNGLNVAGSVTAVSFSGDGSALINVNAATLGGQSSTSFAQTGASNTFTADQTINGNLNLTGSVNSAFSLQGNLTDADGEEGANVIGGFGGNAAFAGNTIAPGVIGATIGGGGGAYDPSLLPAIQKPLPPGTASKRLPLHGESRETGRAHGAASSAPPTGLTSGSNSVQMNWGTVGGGLQNTTNGVGSTVAGGWDNFASGAYSFVGGGSGNSASGDYDAAIAGGDENTASGSFSFVGGGVLNIASSNSSTIGGGDSNNVSGQYAAIAGGYFNSGNGNFSAVGGGSNNSADGTDSTVPGGSNNVAFGDYSFAAGCGATANYQGSFVWNSTDGQGNCIQGTQDTGLDQFVALASGGFYFYTSTGGSSGSGAVLPAGSGSWSSLSDRNAKANFLSIEASSLLEKLAAMPVATWNYKSQADSIRHLGPTAQDFRAAFGLGEDDKHISTVDAEGVALAGVQALYAELKHSLAEKNREIEELRARLARLEQSSAGR
jgi:hypothetical protein